MHHRQEIAQQGFALVVALIVLMGVTVLSLAAVKSSKLSLRMAGAEEGKVNAFQTAQSALDAIISNPGNLPTVGKLNQSNGVTLTGSAFTTTGSDSITASAKRTADCLAPPRSGNNASSLTAFSAFAYEADVEVDKVSSGLGRSDMTQGYIILGPKC